jgi:hypothetical protein
MRLELGELSQSEFDALEKDILARLREIRNRQQGGAAISPEHHRVTGVDASFEASSSSTPRQPATRCVCWRCH